MSKFNLLVRVFILIIYLVGILVFWIFSASFPDRFGIVTMFGGVALIAIFLIVLTIIRERTYSLFSHPDFKIGIDILSVMGLSLGLAAIFADPPIW